MKRILSLTLAFVMVLGLVRVTVHADTNDLGMRLLESGEEYQTMTVSQPMIDMIKDMEGFRAEPYWDVSQWSIGYGSSCGTDPDVKPDITVTEEEAEQMLLERLESNYGKTVNNYCKKIGRQPSQQQFDALLDFTYNLGGAWTDGCMLTDWLENPTSEMDFVNAIGRWCRVSSDVTYTTASRRIREALVFLWGEYYLAHGSEDFESELEVVSNHQLPHYKMVVFQAGDGIFSKYSDDIRYYKVGMPYGGFNIPTLEGYTLAGWEVTRINNSRVDDPQSITADALVENNLELTAVWGENGAVDPTEPTDPEPTEPEPTEPEPTEPEPTEPEPTEPEPTEPEPTEPEPTEPEPTEPEPTEPEPTEPEPTEPEPTEPETTDPEPTEPEPDELPFNDVDEGDWFYEPVKYVYQNKYMVGVSDVAFGPQTTMTRGMLVTVLYRIDGSPEVSDEERSYFEDSQGMYCTDAIAWARAYGIAYGVSDTRFNPNAKVIRQDAIAIFYRYSVNYLGMDSGYRKSLDYFIDSEKVSSYALEPMEWAVGENLVAGSPSANGMKLNPKGNLTRAEAATLLTKFVQQLMGFV